MAVAPWVLFQIPLMEFFRWIETCQGLQLHGEEGNGRGLQGSDGADDALVRRVHPVYAGLVLAAAVVALPVLHRGVDDIEVGQQRRTAGAFLNLGSAHIGGERLLDELLQRLRLLLFCDGSYDGFTHDIAAAVDHIGGGISKDVGSKLSRLTI